MTSKINLLREYLHVQECIRLRSEIIPTYSFRHEYFVSRLWHQCLPCLFCSSQNQLVYHPCFKRNAEEKDMTFEQFLFQFCDRFHPEVCHSMLMTGMLTNRTCLKIYEIWNLWNEESISWISMVPEEVLKDIICIIPNEFGVHDHNIIYE